MNILTQRTAFPPHLKSWGVSTPETLMKIRTATMTGADESVTPMQLLNLTLKYNFVEWAILLAANKEGTTRYPSLAWLDGLREVTETFLLPLSGHICGRWSRDIIKGKPTFFEERPTVAPMFRRFQINASPHEVGDHYGNVLQVINRPDPRPTHRRPQYIFQFNDAANYNANFDIAREAGCNVAGLFDKSGGNGIVPSEWPKPYPDVYCGYAGGLGQENLEEQLKRIANVAQDAEVWIDMESGIRSDDGSLFDLARVERCLEIAKAFT